MLWFDYNLVVSGTGKESPADIRRSASGIDRSSRILLTARLQSSSGSRNVHSRNRFPLRPTSPLPCSTRYSTCCLVRARSHRRHERTCQSFLQPCFALTSFKFGRGNSSVIFEGFTDHARRDSFPRQTALLKWSIQVPVTSKFWTDFEPNGNFRHQEVLDRSAKFCQRSFFRRSAANISVSSFLQKQNRTCCAPNAASGL